MTGDGNAHLGVCLLPDDRWPGDPQADSTTLETKRPWLVVGIGETARR